MKNLNKIVGVFVIISLVFYSCNDNVLDVANGNDPDYKKVYAKGSDVESVASGLFRTYYVGEHGLGVQPMLAVAADNVTCSHGNFAMWHASSEPRDLAWDNAPSYSNASVTKTNYDRAYSVIVTANNVIKAIESGVEIGTNGSGNDRTMAVARLMQGLGYGMLALLFDRAHVVDENTTVEGVLESAVPYQEVAKAALVFLDKALTHTNTQFTIPASWFHSENDLTNQDLKKIINTSAARILSYTPRNKTELAAVDWPKVKTYADNGITSDWNVVADDDTWYDEAGYYLTVTAWGRTDMYVVNMMDPTQPQHWENRPDFPLPPASTNPIDSRLLTDFGYLSSNNFQPARGYFNYSNYRFSRHDEHYKTWIGPKGQVLLSENDMLRAEARVYTNDFIGAAQIINAGTRVTRGKMTPVAANKEDLVKAIHHERHVELYCTGTGLQFFEMRKLDLLQKGTFLHLPLPAGILETLSVPLPFYTFGTVAKADGKNTSNGGWR